MTPLVRLQGIRKEFPGVVANDDVSLEINAGEVLGLLGENGAGKTTLMNILYGLYRPDAGKIFVRGEERQFRSPRDAIDHDIGMVHQHFMLIPVHTVVENILLGSRHNKRLLPNWEAEAARIAEFSASHGLSVDPTVRVDRLPLGMQQRVEIVKALYYGAELLILDEPTGVLTPQEVGELLQVLRKLAEGGRAVVFITHKLGEAIAVTDRIVVLRGGKKVGEVATSQTSAVELARMMVGREVLFSIDRQHTVRDEVVLRLENISTEDDRGRRVLRNVSLEVRAGEVLGVAGIDGNGQRELAETIVGMRTPVEGRVEILGRDTRRLSTARVHALGVGIIPEDRHASGLLLDLPLEENLVLEQFDQAPFSRLGVLRPRAIRRKAEELIREYAIHTPGPKTLAGNLSGGNQQKAVLARALAQNPKLIVAAQPTRGLDVAATEYVRQRLVDQAQQGCSVLMISTELDEILMLSDRIVVLFEGQVMGTVPRKEATRENIGLMMAGTRQSELARGLE